VGERRTPHGLHHHPVASKFPLADIGDLYY